MRIDMKELELKQAVIDCMIRTVHIRLVDTFKDFDEYKHLKITTSGGTMLVYDTEPVAEEIIRTIRRM